MHKMILSYHCSMSSGRSGDLLRNLVGKLETSYGPEALPLALILLEDILNLSRNDILLGTTVEITSDQQQILDEYLLKLLDNIPIQHLVGWAEFYGHRFLVNEHVLIPRQETEELVETVAGLIKENGYQSLVDIGTGSGCIGIILALEAPDLKVTAVDISNSALEVARENARRHGLHLKFRQLDILKEGLPGSYDVIVSNPPYVLESEKPAMPRNVIEHDPESALFVPDEQPLLFYEKITSLASQQLNDHGLLFYEINEKLGPETMAVLKNHGFVGVELKNDLNGKPRFVYGFKK